MIICCSRINPQTDHTVLLLPHPRLFLQKIPDLFQHAYCIVITKAHHTILGIPQLLDIGLYIPAQQQPDPRSPCRNAHKQQAAVGRQSSKSCT